jgi:hypothetical protein
MTCRTGPNTTLVKKCAVGEEQRVRGDSKTARLQETSNRRACETETRGQPRRREWAPLMSARAWDCPSLNHQGRRGIPHAHGWMLVAKRGR